MGKPGFKIDLSRCIGCKSCQVACKDRNDLEAGMFFRRVVTLPRQEGWVHWSGSCHHCAQPACTSICPTGAMHKAEDGTVQHNSGMCIGCGACVWSCPYGAPKLSDKKGVSQKCSSCSDKRQRGERPACVEACTTQCLQFTEIMDESIDVEYDRIRYPDLQIQRAAGEKINNFLSETGPKSVSSQDVTYRNDSDETVVILGSGIAGLSAAAAVRARDHTCRILMLSAERLPSYCRPMLTKMPFKGFTPDHTFVFERAWYDAMRIEIVPNKYARRIISEQRRVEFSDRSVLDYDKCIYALGAESFVPPPFDPTMEGIFTIRHTSDIESIRIRMLHAKDVLVIGGGAIGLESAWMLKNAGANVTILELANRLMERLIGAEVSIILQELIEKEGIEVHTGIRVEKVIGKDRIKGIRLLDGRLFPADIVVLACGNKANIDPLAETDIDVGRSVIVNEKMETSADCIYACGDCTELNGIASGTWMQSVLQGRVAGANAAGDDVIYTPVPTELFFHGMHTDLYAIGDPARNLDRTYEIVKTDTATEELPQSSLTNEQNHDALAVERFYYSDDRFVGGILLGDLQKLALIRKAVSEIWSMAEFDEANDYWMQKEGNSR